MRSDESTKTPMQRHKLTRLNSQAHASIVKVITGVFVALTLNKSVLNVEKEVIYKSSAIVYTHIHKRKHREKLVKTIAVTTDEAVTGTNHLDHTPRTRVTTAPMTDSRRRNAWLKQLHTLRGVKIQGQENSWQD
jgi:hypothetical protein